MSEFTLTKEKRVDKLLEVSKLILNSGDVHAFISENKSFISSAVPSDFIMLFDELIQEGHSMKRMKMLVNKVLNIFHQTIDQHQRLNPEPNSFLWVCEENNRAMERKLDEIRPVFKAFVKDLSNNALYDTLLHLFIQLEEFGKYYVLKENILFPVIEKSWSDYRCIQIMWSFHDDIRRNIKLVINQLKERNIDPRVFNRCVGDIFFNMLAIKFREEKILFPELLLSLPDNQLKTMKKEAIELGFPYFTPENREVVLPSGNAVDGLVNLGTGQLSVDQVCMIFNHLPVDITFVDENGKVRYFSSPKKRIFPRTTAVLGREVQNCHPPESVHVVLKIVDSFRSGEKDSATFWIRMKGELILIQYFAVRDESGIYRGIIEVTQEITEIIAIEGEKRLLEW
ncbi:MAG TPA: PAS domain-containing protein [Prolixibacteraceae bacterium]|nr:PAS domain-containing protein [Prolixibacteraceae bacterium]HUM88501.1 PAS domain-containing protein [Prolixibacteraceae bacterium]